tara:strand:- start:297 stop:632 length:336 start_codon:yes stop_codon:yes gene_type:complete
VPLLNILTNKKIKNEQKFLANSSNFISSQLKKPENFCMIKFTHSLSMYFAGSCEPCIFIEIKSIGALYPLKLSKPICEFFSNELEIPTERIYIFFQDVEPCNWAWNNKTFS